MEETIKAQEQFQEKPHHNSPETKDLQTKLDTCLVESKSWQEKYLRSLADFQNYQRRMEKEQGVWMSTAQASMLKELLPIIDDMERAALESQKKELSEDMTGWLAGFVMINTAFAKFLKKYGVEEIPANGQFDPHLHEALASVESPDKKEGDIVEILQKGYRLKDQVLRPAKVTVAR